MTDPHVLYDVGDAIATITLNRPEARNAFSDEMIRLWRDRLVEAGEDDDVCVVVVTGRGDTFCSGGDIKAMAEGRLASWDMKRFLWDGVHRIALAMEDLDKPVIASINGAAMGAGLDMALLCDLRVCSDRARLAETYVLMGLAPGDGGALLLPRVIGLPRAMEMLLTGDVITPDEAQKIGLVNRVVAHESLMDETMRLARRIAERPPLAVRMIKRAVMQGLGQDLRTHLDCISSQLSLLSQTEDHREAALAFLERRKPRFRGR